MDNKEKPLDIYLMGIGGTGMGAFAGLLKQKGHHVHGSDSALYSPMKEKLREWGIKARTPYHADNLPTSCDLVIVGNVIRRDNPEALALMEKKLPYESFPSALNKLFLKNAIPLVASGTHGKTTCTAMLSHTLFHAGFDPGFLIGGIPLNFLESFRGSKENAPFVIEGDEYDTAFFDKRPKFIHYDPKILLVTSLEFDHGDIYKDIDAIVAAFSSVMATMKEKNVVVFNNEYDTIKRALEQSSCKAQRYSYGKLGDFQAVDCSFDKLGINFGVKFRNQNLGDLRVPLFGEHNLSNALGCYAVLYSFGMSHEQIKAGFQSFLGVKRRLEERISENGYIVVDDFAHHPTAVKETIKAAKQKYPAHKICAVFEPRSATSCRKVFQNDYENAFLLADEVMLAPIGRNLPEHDRLDTKEIARVLNNRGVKTRAYFNYDELRADVKNPKKNHVLLFMSNGDFQGLLCDMHKIVRGSTEPKILV